MKIRVRKQLIPTIFLVLLSQNILLYAQSTSQTRSSSSLTDEFVKKSDSLSEDIVVNLSGVWDIYPDKTAYPNWKTTIDVPGFYVWKKVATERFTFPDIEMSPWRIFEGHAEGLYQRTFIVPSSMAGHKIFLQFGGVNFQSDIIINGQLAGSHFGGYTPFEVDITPYVTIPSTGNTLRVQIRYFTWAFLGEFNNPQTPVGFQGASWNLGIVDSVYLVARSPVYIDDIYVQTSFRDKKILTDVTIVNSDDTDHTISLLGRVENSGVHALSIGSQQLTIPDGETMTVSLEKNWQNPQLWSPETPHLYHCIMELSEDSQIINDKTVRFGFRELWIENNHFKFNGYRYNLRGDNIIIDSEKFLWPYLVPTPDIWSAIIDSMKAFHFNIIRLHQQPAFPWMIDICDEKGMFVVAESPIYGRIPVRSNNYVQNSMDWIQDWIKRDRNHPSIVLWSGSNEVWIWGEGRLLPSHLAQLGSAIVLADPVRPYMFEGDHDAEGDAPVYSYHYMGGFPSMYPWPSTDGVYDAFGPYSHSEKPTSWGEFEWSRGGITREVWVRRQSVVVRTGRIIDVDDIRPYRLDWAWHPVPDFFDVYDGWIPTQQQVEFLANSMNPVAVFDKSYYKYKLFPPLPEYDEGSLVTRQLVIFNDEEEETQVEIRWELLIDTESVRDGSFNVDIPLGTYVERQLTFTAPYVPSDMTFELQLSSWKNGIQKFTEDTPFTSRDAGMAAPSSVSDLDAHQSGNNIILSWSPVTQNTEGDPTTIDHYVLYRATDCHFSTESIEYIQQVTSPSYTDNASDILGNSQKNVFYRVKAVDIHGLSSDFSEIIGEFDYELTSLGTGFNAIGLPLILPGVTDSQSLLALLSSCYSVAQWDANNQGYQQYIPAIPSSNFPVEMGYPYYIQTDKDTIFTLLGSITDPSFNLYTTSTTNFNEIMLPLKKTGISKASDLMDEISYCDGVARWNSHLQGFEQYIPEIASTDFNMFIGYTYYVNVTQSTSWPSGGIPNKNISPNDQYKNLNSIGQNVPHAVWGKWMTDSDNFYDTIHFSAYIMNRPDEILTDLSQGSVITESHWVVQCGNFPTLWKAGDILKVDFYGLNGLQGVLEIQLSHAASDQSDDVILINGMSIPDDYKLHQNYPNPFNGTTTIQYSLPEPANVEITIFNLLGQKIRTLIPYSNKTIGFHTVLWDGTDSNNNPVTSGLYFVSMKTDGFSQTMRIHLSR